MFGAVPRCGQGFRRHEPIFGGRAQMVGPVLGLRLWGLRLRSLERGEWGVDVFGHRCAEGAVWVLWGWCRWAWGL